MIQQHIQKIIVTLMIAAVISVGGTVVGIPLIHYRVAQAEIDISNRVTLDVLFEKERYAALEIKNIKQTVEKIDGRVHEIQKQTSMILQELRKR